MISAAKIKGLREALEERGRVRFHNGSCVEFEDCPGCEGTGEIPDLDYPLQDPAEAKRRKPCERCAGLKVRLLVTRPAGGTARYRFDEPGDVERAYRMALDGPERVPQPQSDKDFGDDPPW